MKNQKNNVGMKALEVVAELAFKKANKSANTACPLFAYQPKLPVSVQNLRKF